jgi:hypothetical protein
MTRELRRELEVLQNEMDEIRQSAESEIKAAQDAFENVIDTKIDLEPPAGATETTPNNTRAADHTDSETDSLAQTEEPTAAEADSGEVDS